MKKRRGIFAYVVAGTVGLCLCSAIATALNRGSPASTSPGIAPAATIFATLPATVVSSPEPTLAPTLTPEPTVTEPPPTLTTEPTAAPLPTVEPVTPTAQIEAPTATPVATETPTIAPVPAIVTEADGSLSVPPTGADADGKNPYVEPSWPSWLPCQQGQIKGSQSGKHHRPGGRYYRFTFSNVRCFNSEAEAEAAGFVMAQNQ